VKSITRRSVLCASLASIAPRSWAQSDWPTKPILLILGFPPGGPNDLVARVMGQRLTEQLKQPIVIENRPGANGNIAAGLVSRAPPDGYTFLYNSSSLALSPALYSKSTVDPRKDFIAVNSTAALPLVCVVESSFPANNFREWAEQLRAHPGKFNYGSPGVGNLAHVAAAMILKANGLDAVHAPYKGSSEALQGLIGGSTQFQFDAVNSPLSLIKAGRLKALFVTSAQRSAVLPDVPTLLEGGSRPIEATAWQGVMAPAKVPLQIVQRFSSEIAKAMTSPEMKAALSAQGAYSIASTPERYAAFFNEEMDRYKRTVEELGLKLD
jgi:tripartite-type tricarboxylate transporter receptor subunit TctC